MFKELIIGCSVFAFFIFTIGYGVVQLDRRSCSSVASKMEMEYSHSIATGCMVKYKNQWVPLAILRMGDN